MIGIAEKKIILEAMFFYRAITVPWKGVSHHRALPRADKSLLEKSLVKYEQLVIFIQNIGWKAIFKIFPNVYSIYSKCSCWKKTSLQA